MTTAARARRISHRVTIVSTNAATLADLQRYLSGSGIEAEVLAAIDPARVSAASTAVVLFPDDYPAEAGGRFVEALRHARPRVLVMAVTREPERLAALSLLGGDDAAESVAPLVLPKPSFGWSIVDAIRAHADHG